MAVTYELQLRFTGKQAAALRLKQKVLAWLAQHGVTNFVESLVDGIHDPVADADIKDAGDAGFVVEKNTSAPWSFDTPDTAPIALYDRDEHTLQRLSAALARAFPDGVTMSQAILSDESWSAAWDEVTELIQTKHFIVLPPGGQTPGDGVVPLYVQPGEAFGSGRHATTQVALEIMEHLFHETQGRILEIISASHAPVPRILPRGRMLDVGTGSGILMVAAARLGFNDLVGTEIDQAVLEEARANLKLNGVVGQLSLSQSPPRSDSPFDLVVANILAPVLHQLMPDFAACLAPEGVVLLSGFVAKEESDIVRTAQQWGLTVIMRGECRGWVGLVLGK